MAAYRITLFLQPKDTLKTIVTVHAQDEHAALLEARALVESQNVMFYVHEWTIEPQKPQPSAASPYVN